MKSTAVYALTPKGIELGRRIAESLGGELHVPQRFAAQSGGPGSEALGFEALLPLVAGTFHLYKRHVFVTAAGIAVRAIAPLMCGKAKDPAVAVMDQEGRFAVSILSGHLGGANELVRELSGITGAEPVITTATDSAGLPALDMLAGEAGLVADDPGKFKIVSAALLEGRDVQIFDPDGRLSLHKEPLFVHKLSQEWEANKPGVWVDWRSGGGFSETLRLYPPVLALGLGCRRGAKASEIVNLVKKTLSDNGLALESVARAGSIEAKADEEGLLLAVRELGLAPEFFSAESLKGVTVENPSETVLRHMGVESVCEAAARLLSRNGRLVASKTKSPQATAAVALMSDTEK